MIRKSALFGLILLAGCEKITILSEKPLGEPYERVESCTYPMMMLMPYIDPNSGQRTMRQQWYYLPGQERVRRQNIQIIYRKGEKSEKFVRTEERLLQTLTNCR